MSKRKQPSSESWQQEEDEERATRRSTRHRRADEAIYVSDSLRTRKEHLLQAFVFARLDFEKISNRVDEFEADFRLNTQAAGRDLEELDQQLERFSNSFFSFLSRRSLFMKAFQSSESEVVQTEEDQKNVPTSQRNKEDLYPAVATWERDQDYAQGDKTRSMQNHFRIAIPRSGHRELQQGNVAQDMGISGEVFNEDVMPPEETPRRQSNQKDELGKLRAIQNEQTKQTEREQQHNEKFDLFNDQVEHKLDLTKQREIDTRNENVADSTNGGSTHFIAGDDNAENDDGSVLSISFPPSPCPFSLSYGHPGHEVVAQSSSQDTAADTRRRVTRKKVLRPWHITDHSQDETRQENNPDTLSESQINDIDAVDSTSHDCIDLTWDDHEPRDPNMQNSTHNNQCKSASNAAGIVDLTNIQCIDLTLDNGKSHEPTFKDQNHGSECESRMNAAITVDFTNSKCIDSTSYDGEPCKPISQDLLMDNQCKSGMNTVDTVDSTKSECLDFTLDDDHDKDSDSEKPVPSSLLSLPSNEKCSGHVNNSEREMNQSGAVDLTTSACMNLNTSHSHDNGNENVSAMISDPSHLPNRASELLAAVRVVPSSIQSGRAQNKENAMVQTPSRALNLSFKANAPNAMSVCSNFDDELLMFESCDERTENESFHCFCFKSHQREQIRNLQESESVGTAWEQIQDHDAHKQGQMCPDMNNTLPKENEEVQQNRAEQGQSTKGEVLQFKGMQLERAQTPRNPGEEEGNLWVVQSEPTKHAQMEKEENETRNPTNGIVHECAGDIQYESKTSAVDDVASSSCESMKIIDCKIHNTDDSGTLYISVPTALSSTCADIEHSLVTPSPSLDISGDTKEHIHSWHSKISDRFSGIPTKVNSHDSLDRNGRGDIDPLNSPNSKCNDEAEDNSESCHPKMLGGTSDSQCTGRTNALDTINLIKRDNDFHPSRHVHISLGVLIPHSEMCQGNFTQEEDKDGLVLQQEVMQSEETMLPNRNAKKLVNLDAIQSEPTEQLETEKQQEQITNFSIGQIVHMHNLCSQLESDPSTDDVADSNSSKIDHLISDNDTSKNDDDHTLVVSSLSHPTPLSLAVQSSDHPPVLSSSIEGVTVIKQPVEIIDQLYGQTMRDENPDTQCISGEKAVEKSDCNKSKCIDLTLAYGEGHVSADSVPCPHPLVALNEPCLGHFDNSQDKRPMNQSDIRNHIQRETLDLSPSLYYCKDDEESTSKPSDPLPMSDSELVHLLLALPLCITSKGTHRKEDVMTPESSRCLSSTVSQDLNSTHSQDTNSILMKTDTTVKETSHSFDDETLMFELLDEVSENESFHSVSQRSCERNASNFSPEKERQGSPEIQIEEIKRDENTMTQYMTQGRTVGSSQAISYPIRKQQNALSPFIYGNNRTCQRSSGASPVIPHSVGRTRKVLSHLLFRKHGVFAHFGQGAFGTKDRKLSHLVMNNVWNQLCTDVTQTQVMFIGTGIGREQQAIIVERTWHSFPIFFDLKRKDHHIHYVGHWRVISTLWLPPNFTHMGRKRCMKVQFLFARFDSDLARTIEMCSLENTSQHS